MIASFRIVILVGTGPVRSVPGWRAAKFFVGPPWSFPRERGAAYLRAVFFLAFFAVFFLAFFFAAFFAMVIS